MDTLRAVSEGWRNVATGEIEPTSWQRWPSAANTGWEPLGVTLTPYSGPSGYQGNQTIVIEDKIVNSELRIYEDVDLILRRCQINGHIDCDYPGTSVIMEDCHVAAIGWGNAAVGFRNLTIDRCNIEGGITALNASLNVICRDSWLHGQYIEGMVDAHAGGFLCGGGGNILVERCAIVCDVENTDVGGGPSNSVNLFGDLAPLDGITFDGNLILPTPGGYAASWGWNPGKPYGDDPKNIVVRNNVFRRGANGRGGFYGTSTGFKASEPTNIWENNKWEDGTLVDPDEP